MRRFFDLAGIVLVGVCLVALDFAMVGGAVWAWSNPAYRHDGTVLLPNADVTPGKVRTTDRAEVCGTTTPQFRHTTPAMKRQVCRSYGVADCPKQGTLEIDHLIPLELGGADDVANLWPQPADPRPGFHEKDKLENWLHRETCDGRMPLSDAQREIATDWYSAYERMPK